MNRKILITTSWDDGSLYDLKLAQLLQKYNVPAMLFIPAENPERNVVSPSQIRELRNFTEIGSHTYHHRYLNQTNIEEAEKEIVNGRKYLEDILSEKIEHFCYPGGAYNRMIAKRAIRLVKTARTINICYVKNKPGFHIDTSLQFVYRRKLNLWKETLLHAPVEIKKELLYITYSSYQLRDMLDIFLRYVFTQACGNYLIHLWGHTWELEQYDLWYELEEICRILQDYRYYFVTYSDCFSGDK
jgi:peptidoglycan/xylan/chitin deacetylase (PgdA/CDA1 family)